MMKKSISVLLCLIFIVSVIAGCGDDTANTNQTSSVSEVVSAEIHESVSEISDSEGTVLEDKTGNNLINSIGNNKGTSVAAEPGDVIFSKASYVLIYNPLIYYLNNYDSSDLSALKSGYLGDQIVSVANRSGDGTDPLSGYERLESNEIAPLNTDVDFSGLSELPQRGNALDPKYKKGDKHNFFYEDKDGYQQEGSFRCDYAGEYCYIWTLNDSLSKEVAKTYGTEFDKKIYEAVTTAFGKARFTQNGGKVNFLFYQTNESVNGFANSLEALSHDEAVSMYGNNITFNTDHAIVHINSTIPDWMCFGTMAHEFQHYIEFSDVMESYSRIHMGTWLNEAMSAYAEELIYPGIREHKNGSTQYFYFCQEIRSGQSIYNFNHNDGDIGHYGAVYLFEEYLRKQNGNDVFLNIHDYWRKSTADNAYTSYAIANSVSASEKARINKEYNYSDELNSYFYNENEAFLSKLTLDFLIDVNSLKVSNWKAVSEYLNINETDAKSILLSNHIFDIAGGTEIEGGGAILVATRQGGFKRPADSDDYLIYVAFDENMNCLGTSLSK